jgi:hypothetical protein
MNPLYLSKLKYSKVKCGRMANAHDVRPSVRKDSTRRGRSLAKSITKKVLARLWFNGHEGIDMRFFEFVLQVLIVVSPRPRS